MFIIQGSKDVVEFLVMNWTVVDVPGKRDTKKVKVIMMMIMMMIYITNYNNCDDDNDAGDCPLCPPIRILHHKLLHPDSDAGSPCLFHLLHPY